MRISDVDLATTDLDWFAVDELGQLGHFATGGIGWVPESVRSSFEDNELTKNYFSNIASDVSEFDLLYENIPKDIKSQEIDKYTGSFSAMAKKGLFSFDVSVQDRNKRDFYFLIAKPRKNINIDNIPGNIRTVVMKTKLKITFSDVMRVHKSDMGPP